MMGNSINGKAYIFDHNTNIDLIHPASYFSLNPERVKEGLFKGIDTSLSEKISQGGIVVAGRNFGCGSSREVSAQAFVLNNVKVLIAESFARIFFRNCYNLGIILIEHPNIIDMIMDQDELIINPEKKTIENVTQRKIINMNQLTSKSKKAVNSLEGA